MSGELLDWLYEWRAMPMAPKDGSPIMVRRGTAIARAQWIAGAWAVRFGLKLEHWNSIDLDEWTPCLAINENPYA